MEKLNNRKDEEIFNRWTLEGVKEVSSFLLEPKPIPSIKIDIPDTQMSEVPLNYEMLLPLDKDIIRARIEKEEIELADEIKFVSKYRCNILEKEFYSEHTALESEIKRFPTLKDDIYVRLEEEVVKNVLDDQRQLIKD